MKTTYTLDEQIQTYINDMVAVEKHVLNAVNRQLNDDDLSPYPDVRVVLTTVRDRMKSHIDAWEQYLDVYDEDSSTLKNALTGFLGVAAGVIDRIRTYPVSKDLRDTYTALGLVSISYTMLHTTALGMGNSAVAEIALNHLRDVTPLITRISAIIPRVVGFELRADNPELDVTRIDQAIANTQQAWSSEHIYAGMPQV